MKINFPNYIENMKLPLSKALYPLFEAISNSVDAIEERKVKTEEGKIVVTLERIPQILLDENEEETRELLPIKNIIIEDNGIGFRDANFSAFSEINTVQKKSKGGKGVGRVIWLKVFDFAEIQSTYSNGKTNSFRHFNFVANDEPIEIVSETQEDQRSLKTEVRLTNCKKEFQEAIPKKRIAIAQDIVIHFLPYFMVTSMPNLILREEGVDDIDLWDVFSSYIADKGKTDKFVIANQEFSITHTKTKYDSQGNKEHRVFYVAHSRAVEKRGISSDKISHLPAKLQIEDEEYVYVGYVEAPFLDKCVNSSRYRFDIPDKTDGDVLFEQVDWNSIEVSVNSSVENYLGNYLVAAEKDKDEKIRKYINDKAPNYSYIYTQHKDQIDKIPYKSIEKGNIGQELSKIHVALRVNLTEEAERVLNIPTSEIKSADEYKQQLNSLLERLNPTGKADLAEYIIHRKTILGLFEKALRMQDDGKFIKEDAVHNYIFPIKKSTDEVTYDRHNLWLLDERLAYNTYIASDKPFSQISGYENSGEKEKRKRPDIYAYTFSTVAPDDTGSPYKSLDIFEFKRPMRDDYTAEENPFNQIKEYLEIIRQGNATTKEKRTLRVIDGGLIYCHVICDITQSLITMLKNGDFKQVGNQDWYIYYHQAYNAFIEIKSFDFVFETAKKRNQILFDKLGLK